MPVRAEEIEPCVAVLDNLHIGREVDAIAIVRKQLGCRRERCPAVRRGRVVVMLGPGIIGTKEQVNRVVCLVRQLVGVGVAVAGQGER
jgi:hypothetical protein